MPNHVTNVVTFSGKDAHKVLMNFINKEGEFDFNKIAPVPKELNIEDNSLTDNIARLLRGLKPLYIKNLPDDTNEALNYLKNKMGNEYPKHLNNAKQYNTNIEKYGFKTWYDAKISMWGTKWNAYSQHIPLIEYPKERFTGTKNKFGYRHKTAYSKRVIKKQQKRYEITEIHFETAWCTPVGIWNTLCTLLPEGVTVNVKYADEDIGCNCGEFSFNNKGAIFENAAPDYNLATIEESRYWTKFAFNIVNNGSNPREYGYDDNWDYVGE